MPSVLSLLALQPAGRLDSPSAPPLNFADGPRPDSLSLPGFVRALRERKEGSRLHIVEDAYWIGKQAMEGIRHAASHVLPVAQLWY